jgi:hypothetical protein
MNRAPAIPLRPDYSARPRAGVHLERAALVAARRAIGAGTEAQIIRSLWGADDQVTGLVLRAAVPPATTTAAGWAAALAVQVVGDFIIGLGPVSAAARLIEAGLRVSLDGVDSVLIPRRIDRPAGDVKWVGQGQPIPARRFTFDNATLGPTKKMGAIVGLSREQVTHSAAEAIVRTLLREDISASLDASLFSTFAGDADRPPGILAGVSPLTPTTGGGEAAMLTDLQALAAALTENGATNVVYIAATQQVATAQLRLGRDRAVTMWPSAALDVGTVIAIEPAGFVSAFGPEPTIEASFQATIHFEDTTPAQIGTPGTPAVVAGPTSSVFQQGPHHLEMHARRGLDDARERPSRCHQRHHLVNPWTRSSAAPSSTKAGRPWSASRGAQRRPLSGLRDAPAPSATPAADPF